MFDISFPEFFRALAAFLILFILPGWLFIRILFRGLYTDLELIPASFCASLVLYLPTVFLWKSGGNGLVLSGLLLLILGGALLVLNILMRPERRERKEFGDHRGSRFSIESAAIGIILVLIVFSMFREKGTLGFTHDSLDHVSAIREAVQTGRVFPATTFYADGDGEGLDPRKGIFQPAMALVSVVSRVDPARMWMFLPVFLAPILFLCFYSFTREIFGTKGISILAAVLFFFCFAGSGVKWLRMAAYGNRIAEGVTWVTLAYLLKYVRTGNFRTCVFFILLSAAAVSVHIFSVVYVGIAGAGYVLSLLLYRGADRKPALGRIARASTLFILTVLPFSVFRFFTFGPAVNPIHTHEQGILHISRHLYIINPLDAPHGGGWTVLLAILLVPAVYGRMVKNTSVAFLAGSSILPVLLALNPAVVPLLAPRMGYLVQRFIYVIPYIQVVALFIWEGMGSFRLRGKTAVKIYSAAGLAVLLFFLKTDISTTLSSYSASSLSAEKRETPIAWYPELRFLDKEFEKTVVILSDPLTSYSIPALTRHTTVAVLHQHSSPTDQFAIERLDDASDVLNPFISIKETMRLVRKHSVDVIFLNQTFEKPVILFRGTVDPRLYGRQREKFDRYPQFFHRLVYDRNVAVYEVVKGGADEVADDTAPAVPYILDKLPSAASAAGNPSVNYGISLAGAEFPEKAGRGKSFDMACYWKKVSDVSSNLPIMVFVRFDGEFKKGPLYRQSYGKLYRKVVEKRSGRLFRFREDHVPAGGEFPPRKWPTEKVILDKFTVGVPLNMAPGFYDIRVKMSAEPMLPNFSLRDFLVDEDYYSGAKVGRILIE